MSFERIKKRLQDRKPSLALLIDPDKFDPDLVRMSAGKQVSCFLVGGSRLEQGNVAETVRAIKKLTKLPVLLFPGDEEQLCAQADGLLLLSLLSGRNPEYLIGKHVKAAPLIRKLKLKILSTAYLLIGDRSLSSTQVVTGTTPLKSSNKKLILHTCLAAEQLGFATIYLEGGSGTKESVPPSLVSYIARQCRLPLIVGGGINSGVKARRLLDAGATMIVVGNALEKNVSLLADLEESFRS